MAGSNAQLRRQRSSTPAEILEMLGGHEVLPPAANVPLAAPAGPAGQTLKQRLGLPHLNLAEAAAYLGCSVATLKRKMRRREIPFHRRPGTPSYFLRSEIDRWLSAPETLVSENDRAISKEPQDGAKNSDNFNGRSIEQLLRERATFPTSKGQG